MRRFDEEDDECDDGRADDDGPGDVGFEDAAFGDETAGTEETTGFGEEAGTGEDDVGGRGEETGGGDDCPVPPLVPPVVLPHEGPFWHEPPQSHPLFHVHGDVQELRTFTPAHLSHVRGVDGFDDEAGSGGMGGVDDDATGGIDDVPPFELLPPF